MLSVFVKRFPQSAEHHALAITYATAAGRGYWQRYTRMRYGSTWHDANDTNARAEHDVNDYNALLRNATDSLLLAKELACATKVVTTCPCARANFWFGQVRSAVSGSAKDPAVVSAFRRSASNPDCDIVYERGREALSLIGDGIDGSE